MPRTDRSPLAAAVADALDAYDVIVLLPRYWSYPDRESATAHVVLGEIASFRTPTAGPRSRVPGAKRWVSR
ncbi:hypothetical protein ACFFKE_11360 [Streptomyces mutabilis]|uniref:hypothetical protein n=1 Tax=Streptomyces mutabilis TaxID=67332 RepID=UPI001781545C|nr:hypothetical protein [Streptomyces mutabilis]GGQ45642.1 hypothetical protein GCM10010279_64180 [Streptomyces mutabilis]